MEPTEAARILRRLSSGLDPITERQIEGEEALSVLNRASTVRALYTGVAALEQQQRRARGERPANQGKPWTEDEDRKLLAAFDSGRISVDELRDAHKRTRSGIRARLSKYGRIA